MRIGGSKQQSEQRAMYSGGHRHFCEKCRKFTLHENSIVGNGTPLLSMKCRSCGSEEKFIYAAGSWIPESIVKSLDSYMNERITKVVDGLKPVEKVTDDLSLPAPELSWIKKFSLKPKKDGDDDHYTGSKAWQTLRSFGTAEEPDTNEAKATRKPRLRRILAVAGSVPMFLMGALGVLAYNGIFVHPIYEWIAPYYQPWMNTRWLTILPLMGALFLAYLGVRGDKKRVADFDKELDDL